MKILVVYGTRPEAVKLAPVVRALKLNPNMDVMVLTTGQHPHLVETINELFGIRVDFKEDVFLPGQTINEILSKSLVCISRVIKENSPDLLVVQGDTTTAMAGAIAAFYCGKSVAHVEAGLRTDNISAPFPEEFNRRVISLCTSLHLAATVANKENLISEGVREENIFVTGNTVLDAAKFVANLDKKIVSRFDLDSFFRKEEEYFLLTLHRRESWGLPMKSILREIVNISIDFPEINILFPVHPNPILGALAQELLGDRKNVYLVPALDYVDMIQAISKSKFVVTDSGGIQEEAPFFKKPVLVLRNETERQEGIIAGCSKLVGTEGRKVYSSIHQLLSSEVELNRMILDFSLYGDGESSERILSIIEWFLGFSHERPKDFA